jgi:Transposase IS66 family
VPGLKRDQVFAGVRTPALGGDLTSVKCKGEWSPLGITVDPISGLALTIDALAAQDIKTLQDWIEPSAKSVGATVLVTDDADGFKTVADEAGVQHQVCQAHVLRNTEALIEKYQPLVAADADGSLTAIEVSPEQAAADLTRLGELVVDRRSRRLNWKRCTGAIWALRRHQRERAEVWPIGSGSCFWIAGTCGIA